MIDDCHLDRLPREDGQVSRRDARPRISYAVFSARDLCNHVQPFASLLLSEVWITGIYNRESDIQSASLIERLTAAPPVDTYHCLRMAASTLLFV